MNTSVLNPQTPLVLFDMITCRTSVTPPKSLYRVSNTTKLQATNSWLCGATFDGHVSSLKPKKVHTSAHFSPTDLKLSYVCVHKLSSSHSGHTLIDGLLSSKHSSLYGIWCTMRTTVFHHINQQCRTSTNPSSVVHIATPLDEYRSDDTVFRDVTDISRRPVPYYKLV